jgi:probable rRNA maturation factor
VNVFIANEQELAVDEVRLSALARHTLVAEQVDESIELSVLFVSSEHIRRLNARFAGNDYATDVLSFPMLEDDDPTTMLGDVVICPEVAQSNAAQLGHDLVTELEALVVHGTLHLLGYDHQGDAEKSRMDSRMKEVLKSFETAR